MNCRTDEGLTCSLIDRDFWLADCGKGGTGVNCSVVNRGIAVDGGDAEEIGGRVVGGEENGEDVLGNVSECLAFRHTNEAVLGICIVSTSSGTRAACQMAV